MDNLLLALNVVFPLMIMMILGYFLKKINFVDDHSLNVMNNLVFRVFMAILLFLNIYNVEIGDTLNISNIQLIVFAVVSLIIYILVLSFIVPLFVKDKQKCSAMIHGMFRANLVLFGIPITVSIYGEDSIGFVSLLSAVLVPVFNIAAVTLLEVYRGGKVSFKKVILGIISNPLIQAAALAIIFILIGIRIPDLILTPLESISKITTPLAFIILGASLKFGSLARNFKYLATVVIGKLIFFPVVVISIALLLGYRNNAIVALLGAAASPSAVASFTMSKAMGSDGDLAGEIVVTTSIVSMITIFLWVLVLKNLLFI
jgi:predicted permease